MLDNEENRVLDKAGKPVFNAVPTTDWGSPETLEEAAAYSGINKLRKLSDNEHASLR